MNENAVPGSSIASICRDPRVATLWQNLGSDSQLHVVGGAVRDLLQGLPPKDLDFATILPPEAVRDRLTRAGIRVIDTGIAHGTVRVLIGEDGVEVTTFRMPGPRVGGSYSDTIERDLAGRDFTINAMAIAVATGQLLDPFNGRRDLAEGVLRAVGSAEERFNEDPHRVMRLVRFYAAADRAVDPATLSAARDAAPLLVKVSAERVRDEFVKILCAPRVIPAMKLLLELEILLQILPEIAPSIGCEQNEFHQHDVFEHTLHVIAAAPPTPLLRLTALFHDLGKPATLSIGDDGRRHFYLHEIESERIARAVMERLRFSHALTDEVAAMVRLHMRPLDCGPAGTRRLIRDLGEKMDPWVDFKIADALTTKVDGDKIRDQVAGFRANLETERRRAAASGKSSLAINGSDLLELGMRPGKELGEMLRALNELILDDPLQNTREALIAEARRRLQLLRQS